MFLKSLSMKGFKSFADPTVLEFEPGITVVVGPNGSGKSNVVDAVTWVLGAQGPRSLRSQRMEDVIFAGTTSRPALGRAEVSLTIDNSSGKLPVNLAEVTITRTLFRSGDSEYAINGTPCRLLDIQDLLSDSGVGRQQHMIVGQNQLDAVLNARPEDRRAVIEEAAGVLKHRRRRERAERRLAATQENLERLGDLVRELRRQIRPLERQAAAARSHASIATELRGVRLYLAGRELADLAARRAAATQGLAACQAEERTLDEALAALDAAAAATAAELSSDREEDLAAALGRVQALVERARGTANVLKERSRSLSAALDAAADVDVVSTLESEASRLANELAAADAEAARLEPLLTAAAAAAARVGAGGRDGAGGEPDPAESGEAVAIAATAAAAEAVSEARQRVLLDRRAVEEGRRTLQALEGRIGGLTARVAELDAAAAALALRVDEQAADTDRLVGATQRAEQFAHAAVEQEEESLRASRDAEQERHRTAARADALARALRELEGAGGREELAGVDGVVGSLVDLVEIDTGWERAFEAAAGTFVAAVVVSGREAARQALDRLHRRGATGALLAAGAMARRLPLPALDGPLPHGAEPVRGHVRLRAHAAVGHVGVEAALDALVGSAVRVPGWEEAMDLALDRPDLVVVTAVGDRFADAGWRVRSGSGVVTAAAVEDAERRAAEAANVADAAAARREVAHRAATEARDAAAVAVREADRHDAARVATAREAEALAAERRRVAADLTTAGDDRQRAEAEAVAAAGSVAAAEGELVTREEAAARAAQAASVAAAARADLEHRRAEAAARLHDLDVQAAGVEERRRVLTERRAEVERRLVGHAEEREEAAARRRRLESDATAVVRLGDVVDGERRRLEAVLDTLRADYRHQLQRVRAGAQRMEDLRRERGTAELRQAEVRERSRQFDREAAEAEVRGEALADAVRHDLGSSPDDATEAPAPELPGGVTAAAHAADLSDRLAALGPVNPLALDELSALEERHRELDTQMEDVRAARRQLHEVVRTLDREIMESFAGAVADVNEHFSALVAMLFPGGTGRLLLTEPGDLLATGVEVEVRPAGRNVRRVSLLSGGERALAALAFLFAVFRSRPSPFYLLDEVEAALDDVNLHRFLGLVDEFRDEAQLIIVSHQKRTMEAGDALYGVTMAPGGSSQVVSQRAARRAEHRAEAAAAS